MQSVCATQPGDLAIEEAEEVEPRECDWCGREYLPHAGKLDHCCPACNAAYQSVYSPKGGASC